MFGLSLVQLLVVAVGVVSGTILMVVGLVPVGLVVMAGVGALGTVRSHGTSVVELIPNSIRFLRTSRRGGRSSWVSVLPVLGGDGTRPAPAPLTGQELLVVDAAAIGVGRPGVKVAVSHDKVNDTLAATLRVAGRQFGLLEPGEQDWLVTQWGIALQAFVSERTSVVNLRWSQWAAPAGLDEHRAWIAEHLAVQPLDGAKAAYEDLLREAGSTAIRHETLVTVTVAVSKVRRRRRDADRVAPAVESLLKEMRLFGQRLQGAGLIVSAPLTPAEWSRAIRLRLDPTSRTALDGRLRSLGDTDGAAHPANAAPLAVETTWMGWHTDGAWHRAFYVSDWPRLDVHAAWLKDLMLFVGSVRTVAVFLEPIARSKSQRSIIRDAAKIESDAAHRAEKGFRVGAHHRRARRAVEEREEELVAGYGEFSYAGIVTVTATTPEELDVVANDITQVGASIGLDLRPLHGRHDHAVTATLPVARGLVPKDWL
jgi:hypothetical protein